MKVTVKVGFRAETSSHFPLTFYRIQERKCILKETSEKRGRMNVTKDTGQPFLLVFFFCLFGLFASPDPTKSTFTVTSRGCVGDLTLACTPT